MISTAAYEALMLQSIDQRQEIERLRDTLRDLLPYAETCVPNPISVGEENVIAKAKRLLGETVNR